MAAPPATGGRFSALLLEGLDHYRKGKMIEAVRAWEEAYLLEPTNLRAREFLRSALERIHAHMGPAAAKPAPVLHPWLPQGLPPAGNAAKEPVKAPAKAPAPQPSSTSPWDDGPSIALPDESEPLIENSGAWQIHQEATAVAPVEDTELEVWLRGAHELLALNDFSGALELTAKILQRKPDDSEARKMHDLCEHNLTQMFESRIGAMDARPKVTLPPDEIIWLNLDPRAGFVLAQIDAEVSFEDLYAICGLKRLDTARILSQLLDEGVIAVEGHGRAVAKRALHPR